MKNNKFLFIAIMLISMSGMIACKKSGENLYIPVEQEHFLGSSSGTYFVINTTGTYKVGVGATTVSDKDRTVTVGFTSKTNATEGTQFSFVKKTVTIPAGKAVATDSITLLGVYSQYTSGRKDTLKLFITPSEGKTSYAYMDTVNLIIRGACFDATDINSTSIQELVGSYPNTIERFYTNATGAFTTYGPYTTTVKSITSTGPTTAEAVVGNLWDDGWADVKFILDWTNINNRTTTMTPATGTVVKDASTFSTTYAGYPGVVAPATSTVAGGTTTGTFSLCGQTLVLKFRPGVQGLGYFGNTIQESLAK
jgi:hypothetical protein